MSKVKQVFKSKESVLSEINRLDKIYKESGSVICSYPKEIDFSKETQNLFEVNGFLVEDKDVAMQTYSVVSKNDWD